LSIIFKISALTLYILLPLNDKINKLLVPNDALLCRFLRIIAKHCIRVFENRFINPYLISNFARCKKIKI